MQFGWLNLTGFVIIALMMIPNIIYALNKHQMQNKCTCMPIIIIEQIGRYASMVLMVIPLCVWEFGFSSSEEFVIWTVLCIAMLLAYYVCWIIYSKKESIMAVLFLAILPSAIFILRGVFLRHWLLTVSGVIFAIGHIYITWYNNRKEVQSK